MTIQPSHTRGNGWSSALPLLLVWLTWVPIVSAGDVNSAPSPVAVDVIDPSQWTTIKSVTANFGKQLPHATVLLLKSVAATGSQGGMPIDDPLEPLQSANVIVIAGARVLYSYAPLAVPALDYDRKDSIFYWSDQLDLRDVTGDRVPEIVFESRIQQGVSSVSMNVHVVQFRPAKAGLGTFRDVRQPGFQESEWSAFRWFEFEGQTLAMVADSEDAPLPPGTDEETQIDMHCHSCPRVHRYLVYRWDAKHEAFTLRRTIPPGPTLHNFGDDPWEDDYILHYETPSVTQDGSL